jgi:hypothetical protein
MEQQEALQSGLVVVVAVFVLARQQHQQHAGYVYFAQIECR